MEMINSRNNALIKLIRSLKDKKFRDRENLFIVEGEKMVFEALKSKEEIFKIVCTSALSEKLSDSFNVDFETVSDDVFKSISDETTPQGILALVKKPENLLTAPSGDCLLLDGVSDPKNVGAIIRTAACSGYREVYIANGADPFSPKAVRTSMSGIFKVKVYSGDLEDILKVINIPKVVADMNGVNVFKNNGLKNFCLIVGNEAHGVSKTLKESADLTVSIPMQNEMESLNVAVSAGILMYALKNH